ncbi:PREDICTED: caveolin-2-like [Branchiostoma belcheri]|uniref:Caveolin n=1 Tax=Branchiostoma belcheri TaxID=7741 RepID=A0A6P5AVL1_BRABE|nr:PREDICTED: caveolin-2-like [Branchiostoma belcheri]
MSAGPDDTFLGSEKTSGSNMSYGATTAPPGYDNPNYTYQAMASSAAQQGVVGPQAFVESDRLIQLQRAQHAPGDEEEDMDIYSTKGHVKVTFNEIFNEPQNVTSFEPVKAVNQVVFEYTQSGIYKVLSAGLGVILAVVWGLAFGLFNFFIVWFVHPWLKMCFMAVRLFGLTIKAIVRSCVDPWFQSLGLSLSSIAGRFSLKLSGIPGPRAEPAIAIQNGQ